METVYRFGLIGQSAPTKIITAALEAAFTIRKLSWEYHVLDVADDNLPAEIARLIEEGEQGFLVAEIHRQTVLDLPQVVEVTPAARTIGAATQLSVLPAGEIKADNRQWQAMVHDWEMFRLPVEDAVCLILGTGSSAQAAAYALQQKNAGAITFVSRESLTAQRDMISYDRLATFAPGATLIINATPDSNEMPWPLEVPFPAKAVLYDLVANPPVTRLIKLAQSAGAKAIGGLGALIWQSGYAFEEWTSSTPPLDLMFAAAKSTLNRSL